MAVTRRLLLLSAFFLLSCIDGAKADTCKYEVANYNGDRLYIHKDCPYKCCPSDCCGPSKLDSWADIGLYIGIVLALLAFAFVVACISAFIRYKRRQRLQRELRTRLAQDLPHLAFVNPLCLSTVGVNQDTRVASSSPTTGQPQNDHDIQPVASPSGRDYDQRSLA